MINKRLLKLSRSTATILTIILSLYIVVSIIGAIAAMQLPRKELSYIPSSIGFAYQNISFPARNDGMLLKGWFIPSDGDSAIIIIHGGFQNRIDDVVNTLALARDLNTQNFNLLLFDLRGRGESEGTGRSLSNIEPDIGGAVDYIKSSGFPTDHIVLLGFCSGAASACIFASFENVGALVLDGCFASINSMVAMQASQRRIPHLLLDLFMPGVISAAKVLYDYKEVNPIDIVGQVRYPILFIHEEFDDLIALEDNQNLLETSKNPANSLWEVPGALHSEGYKTRPAEFIAKVTQFLNAAMGHSISFSNSTQ